MAHYNRTVGLGSVYCCLIQIWILIEWILTVASDRLDQYTLDLINGKCGDLEALQKDISKEKVKMDDLGSADKTAEEEHFLGDYVQLLSWT